MIFIIIADIVAVHRHDSSKRNGITRKRSRRGIDRGSVGLKKRIERRVRTRVRIDRRLIYGGQWIDLGPLFTSVATSLLSRVILPLPPTRPTFPATILSNRNFSQSYGKPSTGVEIVSPVIIHLREHALISSLLFQFSSEWKKNVAIIVPSPSLLPALPFSVSFPFEKAKEYRHESNRFVIRTY